MSTASWELPQVSRSLPDALCVIHSPPSFGSLAMGTHPAHSDCAWESPWRSRPGERGGEVPMSTCPGPFLGVLYFPFPFSPTFEPKLNDLANPASQLGLCLLSPKIADGPPCPPGFYVGAGASHSSPLAFAARTGPLSYFLSPQFVLGDSLS